MDRDLSTLETRANNLRALVTTNEKNVIALAAELYWREQALLYSPR